MKRPESRQLIYRCKPAEDYPKEEMDEYITYLLTKIEKLQDALDTRCEDAYGWNTMEWPTRYKELLMKEESI